MRRIIAELAPRKTVLTSAADLGRDLGFAGDDVDELFAALDRMLGPLDMTVVACERHFAMDEPPWHLDLFGRKPRKFERERTALRVRDIETWVETGRWPIEYR